MTEYEFFVTDLNNRLHENIARALQTKAIERARHHKFASKINQKTAMHSVFLEHLTINKGMPLNARALF